MSILGQFQFRRDIAANWTSVNPILLDGELGIESDTDKFKIGDGTTPWNGLMYGGIKGDTGAESTVPGPQGDKGWSPVLANVADGERRVLRLIDWTGGEGTKPVVPTNNYIGPTGFTDLANATDIRGATGAAGATPNSFTSIGVSGQTTIAADSPTDTLTVASGTGITLTTNATTDTLTITNAAPDQTVSLANGTGISVTGTYPSFTITNNDRGSSQNIFKNIAVSGQTTVVADTNDDTLTLAAGSGITITTDAANDTVTFASNINVPNAFTNFLVGTSPTPTSLTPDLAADTLSINAGSGISLTADAGTDTFSINNTGVTSIAQGTGITVSASTGAVTVTNNDTGTSAVNAHVALANPHPQYSRLASVFFFARDYGALTDGIDTATVAGAQADTNTTTIQAAINAAKANGGGIVLLPQGTFHISSTLTIDSSNVVLMGLGAYGNTDASGIPQTGTGTSLFWNNTASPATTAMIDVVSPAGPTNPAVKNPGVEGITLQCAGNVGIGLRVRSIHWGVFKDIYVINPTSEGVATECLVTGTTLGEAADVTKCTFDNIRVRLLEAPAAAVGFALDGASNANTSNSTFRNLAVSCQGSQIALDVRNTDSNRFYDVAINQSNGGTVQPVRLRGGATAGVESRGNAFYYLAAGGSSTGVRGVFSEGTETAGVTAPAKNNVIYGYSIENGEPYPIIGTNSTLIVFPVGGVFDPATPTAQATTITGTGETIAARWALPVNYLQPGKAYQIDILAQITAQTTAGSTTIRVRCGAAGTTADALVATSTASATGAVNAFIQTKVIVYVLTATTITASIQSQQVSAVVGNATAAFAAATINPQTALNLSVSHQQGGVFTTTIRAAKLQALY